MIGSKLKELLEDRNMNVMELSKQAGVSAQTLYSIIKRDNMKIDFDVLVSVCRALDVPVQTFCSVEGPELPSSREWELISRYRRLDRRGRGAVESCIEFELGYAKEKKQ